jgi:hypothetical protein
VGTVCDGEADMSVNLMTHICPVSGFKICTFLHPMCVILGMLVYLKL